MVMPDREPQLVNYRKDDIPYSSSTLMRLAAMSTQVFAKWFRLGIGKHEQSLQQQYDRPDFSGFEPFDSLFGDYSPLRTLANIYNFLSLEARQIFRDALAELTNILPAVTDHETILVAPTALCLAGRVQAPEVFPVLRRRILLSGGWASNRTLYHRSFQLCQALASNSAAAPTLRALVGKDKRNPYFNHEQVRPALRVLLRSEPYKILNHLQFLETEIRNQSVYMIL